MAPAAGRNSVDSSVRVLARAVDILAAFGSGPGSTLSLAEIARRSNLPKSTAHRLLAALEELGLVDKRASGYQLGIRLFELGEHVHRKQKIREAALPFLQDLYEVNRDTVHLAVLDGTDVVYLERIRSHVGSKVASRVGGRMPAYCTAVGKAILAFDPEAEARVVAGPLVPLTRYTLVDPQRLGDDLERIRQTGIALDREEGALGVACAAAPILLDDQVIGAVSVTCSTVSDDVERYIPAVKAAANGIRRSLSTTPGLRLRK